MACCTVYQLWDLLASQLFFLSLHSLALIGDKNPYLKKGVVRNKRDNLCQILSTVSIMYGEQEKLLVDIIVITLKVLKIKNSISNLKIPAPYQKMNENSLPCHSSIIQKVNLLHLTGIKMLQVMMAIIKIIISIHSSKSFLPRDNGSLGYSGNCRNIYKLAIELNQERDYSVFQAFTLCKCINDCIIYWERK